MKNKDKWLPMPRFLLRQNALKKILKKLKLENKKCLEMGFGAGENLKHIAQKGAIVTGFDFSKKAAELAKQRINGLDFTHKITITENTGVLIESSFDMVFAFEVLEHIEEDEKELDKWLSYVKPGGSLIMSVPAHMSKWNASDVWAGHYRRYEKSDLKNMFLSRKLKIEKLWNYGFPLSIILDKILGSSKKMVLKKYTESLDKTKMSKNSGIDRKNKLIYRLISNNIVLYPFYLLQSAFYNKDIGSGYIVHVKKNEK